MNIKELAEQAGFELVKTNNGYAIWTDEGWNTESLERFAELVRQDEREINKELAQALNDVLIHWMSKGISMKDGTREAIVFRKAELALAKSRGDKHD